MSAPIRVFVVESVAKDATEPVLVTFDADEASSLVDTLNELRIQNCVDDEDADPGPVAVLRKALLLYQPCPSAQKEVLA